MEWADAQVWAAVAALPAAADDASLRQRLHHIHMVQRAFLQVWKGDASGPQRSGFDDNAALLGWAREYYAGIDGYLDGLGGEDLQRAAVVPWARMFESRLGRTAAAPTLGETLLQVAMHSAYHRGQVNTRLRELGGEPPLTDFIVWVWAGKPLPAWPDAAS
jgi:uncharacterized damage-inducible protein DinB